MSARTDGRPDRGKKGETTRGPGEGRTRRIAAHAVKRPARRPRDAAATAERILQAAIEEFAAHGYVGARIDAIARRADANMRMLYHYYGSKEALYIKVLEVVFHDIRLQEAELNLKRLAPMAAMEKLFDFTYHHFSSNPLFIRILTSENLLGAEQLKKTPVVSTISSPLMQAIGEVLQRGTAEGVFREALDPLQIYVTMVALSYFHISNAPTLSHLFSADLTDPAWREARRRHASELLKAYLARPHPQTPDD
ncbi:TetR family transcriptional regulator [Acuticoccus mangrovi]|uniref:TetR family transcriptional regulator n=1 Tax=Acuticoccus mangrovi TaxID=2796142 RepID=A0A934IU84_9HYPH|nr:TetR family transcriptional regulator [Acuticoccus mangrovi]MBJ3778267.1 TetR family transcriptional regulator [Acuticoccus mangrovi]